MFNDTDAAATSTIWDIGTTQGSPPGVFEFRTRTDAHGSGATWLSVKRSGTTVTSIDFIGTAMTFNGGAIHAGSPVGSGGGVPDPLLLGDGSDGAPTYSFSASDTTGIYSSAANRIAFTANGTAQFLIRAGSFDSLVGNSPVMLNESVSATNPGFAPHGGDTSSGIGAANVGEVTIICSGIEGSTWIPFNGGVTQAHACDEAITAFATGGIGGATVLRQSYNIVTTVATAGDSVKLPSLYAKNTIIYIKNDGANSLDVFPNNASDNLGLGNGVGQALAAGASIAYIATALNSTWTPLIVPGLSDVAITGGAGSPATPTIGDTLFYDGTNWINLARGTAGQVLTMGSPLLPSWQAPTDGSPLVSPDPLLLSLGSDTNPTYSFAADPNTGLFTTGADQISLVTGAVEATRFTLVGSPQGVLQAVETNVGLSIIGSPPVQGDNVIKSSYNVYDTVATAGDAVTLPVTFIVGTKIWIKNDGGASMDIFPASGDNLGAGVDTAVSLANGSTALFLATVANATWTQLI